MIHPGSLRRGVHPTEGFRAPAPTEVPAQRKQLTPRAKSPGAARRLKTEKHFQMYIDKTVEVSLYKAINDTKRLTGTLVSYNNGEVAVTVDGEDLTLQKEAYGKINLFFDIKEILKQNDGRNSGK